jgi:hypothetical protein
MVQLITTPEEEAAATYLEWDDASLGKLVKAAALTLEDSAGRDAIQRTACCARILAAMLAADSDDTTITIKGLTRKGKPLGDWEVRAVRVDERD